VIREGLSAVKKTFNTYLVVLGGLSLARLTARLSQLFGRTEEEMQVFGLVVYPEYVSAVLGVSFGVYVVVLFLQIRLLKRNLCRALEVDPEERAKLPFIIDRFPWVASPFNSSRLCSGLFWSANALGCLIVFLASYSHLTVVLDTENPEAFRVIGHLDLIVLIVAVTLLVEIKRYISFIRTRFGHQGIATARF